MDDDFFMKIAIDLAVSSAEKGNEPFGAVLVKDGKVVMKGENRVYTDNDVTEHAEFALIKNFIKTTGICNLKDYTLYSSCEPCFMCSGMLVRVRLGRLVYGASNVDLGNILGKYGCDCSRITFENSNYKPEVAAGILREESVKVLKKYFCKT